MTVTKAFDIYNIEAETPIAVTRTGAVTRISANGVTPFRFIPVVDATTTSLALVDLLVVSPDVVVSEAGNVLLDFDTVVTITPGPGLNFKGVGLQFLWDGVGLTSTSFFEIDPGAAGTVFDSFALTVRFRALVAATVGTHTLSVQWQSINAGDTLGVFANNGSLTIQGV